MFPSGPRRVLGGEAYVIAAGPLRIRERSMAVQLRTHADADDFVRHMRECRPTLGTTARARRLSQNSPRRGRKQCSRLPTL
jgi:hypothetical protein